ncbi:MAG: MmgE/PrpD family protein [Alphaproteobacteria bacterium]|nr:MmgE/PrpD family protein [Alphaproteobacteria bacterium]
MTRQTADKDNTQKEALTRRDMFGVGLAGASVALTACATTAGSAHAEEAQEKTKTKKDDKPQPITDLNLTPTTSAYIAGIRSAEIKPEFLELGKRHILDTLASAVACRDLEPAVLARKYAQFKSGDASNAATVLATKERAGIVDAVFAGAMIAHGAEINDFIPSAFVQPGPAVVSTAFALAENRGNSGKDVLHACIAGYELSGRMPKALGIGNLYYSGIANHGIGPCFGAAATAGAMLGLSADQIANVMSYAAQQASGSWQWLLDVEHIEKSFVFAGVGARNGVEAALLVEAGFRGVRDSFDNADGYMNQGVFRGGDRKPKYLIEDLDTRSELPLTAYKRYPVGGPTQPAVQALLELQKHTNAATMESIRIEMPGRWQAFRDAEMPALNLRYLASIIVIDGKLDFVAAQSRERFLNDTQVHELMKRVEIAHDPAQESGTGEERTESARVTINDTKTGTHEQYVPWVRGFPSHPMSRADVEAKALELMEPALGKARAKDVVDATRNIEQLQSAADLVQMVSGS